MALRLYVLTAQLEPPPSVLLKGRRTVIGRSQDADVRIPDPSVSPTHATIIKRGETYLLTDEGSTHGTGIATPISREPVWLSPDSPRVIEEGERIWIGQIELSAHFEAAPRGAPTGFDELAPQLVYAGLSAAGLEPTPELVESTLRELTDLPEEIIPEPDLGPPLAPRGVAALDEDDRHPPWRTDLFIAAMALVILGLCAFGLFRLLELH
jgi:predicted component of type VI protein secretion system